MHTEQTVGGWGREGIKEQENNFPSNYLIKTKSIASCTFFTHVFFFSIIPLDKAEPCYRSEMAYFFSLSSVYIDEKQFFSILIKNEKIRN